MAVDAEAAVRRLLAERAEGATVCPSEVARALAEDWRGAMPAVHAAVDRLVAAGAVRLSWKGVELAARDGPYRIGTAGSHVPESRKGREYRARAGAGAYGVWKERAAVCCGGGGVGQCFRRGVGRFSAAVWRGGIHYGLGGPTRQSRVVSRRWRAAGRPGACGD